MSPLTPARRDALRAVFALLLLAAPLWAPALHLGDPTYRYERARVAVGGERGLSYAGGNTTVGVDAPDVVSAAVGCSTPRDARVCAFERYVAAGHTVPTGVYTTNPDAPPDALGRSHERYRYVLVDGSAYRPVAVANESVRRDDGLYRLDLALEPVGLRDALRAVSLNTTRDRASIPDPVYRAATTGGATAPRRVDVPRTPIRVDDGAYYRVYPAGRTDAPPLGSATESLLAVGGPVAGLALAARLRRRVEIEHVGE